jgi:hypothetical protein
MAASLMLMPALVGPVAATGPGCADVGAASVDAAHNARPFGQLVSSVNHGAFAPVFDGVSQLVQWERGEYCAK